MGGVTRIGFCENGAGYGGAIISLVAMLEKMPAEFSACLYTGLATPDYQRLARFGPWQHMPPVSLISRAWMRARALPLASMVDNIFNVLPYALQHYRAFKRDRIDCVYLNNDASCNMAAALGGWMAGLPLVMHARGFNADTRGNRWVLSKLDHCIAVSQAVRTELLSLGLPPERCTVVPEGLDLNLFYPRAAAPEVRAALGVAASDPVITLVGGLVDWKGQDVLIDAAPLIFELFPNAQIWLVGASYGREDSYAKLIAERVNAPALQGRVRLLGSRQDIPDLLAASDVVLHASTTPEPFGRTFLEGMAIGKPVIASNEGGPLDVIEHERDGLLIAPRDPAVLAAAVLRLLTQKEFAAGMAQQGALKARQYSIEHHTDAVSAALRQTMRQTSTSRAGG